MTGVERFCSNSPRGSIDSRKSANKISEEQGRSKKKQNEEEKVEVFDAEQVFAD